MKNSLQQFMLGTILLFLACAPLLADSPSYETYCNERYGFCVEYPGNLVMETPPANRDGRRFHDDKGFLMIASGINNVLEDTLESESSSQVNYFDTITYRAKGKNWIVLSGYKGSEVLYMKTYVGKRAVNQLYIRYPSRHTKAYGKTVTRISHSFKPGDLGETH